MSLPTSLTSSSLTREDNCTRISFNSNPIHHNTRLLANATIWTLLHSTCFTSIIQVYVPPMSLLRSSYNNAARSFVTTTCASYFKDERQLENKSIQFYHYLLSNYYNTRLLITITTWACLSFILFWGLLNPSTAVRCKLIAGAARGSVRFTFIRRA